MLMIRHFGNKEDYESFESDVNENLNILNNWFKLNKINAEKTNLMIFRKKKRIDPIAIHINQVGITETYFFNFHRYSFQKQIKLD